MFLLFLLLFFVVTGSCNTCTQGFLIGWPPSQYPPCLCVGRVLIDLLSSSGPSINLVLCKVACLFLRLVVRGGSMRRCVWERCGFVARRACVSACVTHWNHQRDSECTQQISAGCGKKNNRFFSHCTKPLFFFLTGFQQGKEKLETCAPI